MKLSALKSKAKDAVTRDVVVDYADEKINMTVRATGLTKKTKAMLRKVKGEAVEAENLTDEDAEAAEEVEEMKAHELCSRILVDLVVKWDIVDEAGKPLPIDLDTIIEWEPEVSNALVLLIQQAVEKLPK